MQLLQKTIRSYFLFSAILLLAAVPVFYYALKKLMISNADENLIATKTRIMPQLWNAATNHHSESLHFLDYEIAFEKESPNKGSDSIYDFYLEGNTTGGIFPGRILSSHLNINQEFYSLHIKTSMLDKTALIRRILWLLVVLLLAMFLGLLTINRLLTKRIWQPFYSTLKKLRQYRVDKEPVLKLEKTGVTEFADLNKAIEELAEKNYQAYAAQKEFTENAAHEMQSPLAVFQSKLELLMQTNPLNEEQAALIEDLASASKRMSRLNKSLVMLTKIDNNQFPEKEEVSVHDILQKLVSQYEFQIKQQSITVSLDMDADILLNANSVLMEILFGNLLSNAIRHNNKGGTIHIIIREKELLIQNSGIPFSLDQEKLFQRFQKQSSNPASVGLGLELVKKICSLNHYDIGYIFHNHLHSFRVHF